MKQDFEEVSEHSIDDRKSLHAALDEWFNRMIDEQPDVNDGENSVFKVEGGRVGYTEAGMPLFSFIIETLVISGLETMRKMGFKP